MIEREGVTIVRAAKKLRIKLPTAKVILRNYRKKGVILDKASTRREKEVLEAAFEGIVEAAGPEKVEEELGGEQGVSLLEPCPYYIIYFGDYSHSFFSTTI